MSVPTDHKDAIAACVATARKLCPDATARELTFFQNVLTVREFKAKEFFLHAAQVQHSIGFVYRGLIRSFYVDDEGAEITVNFVSEGSYATHYSAFLQRESSKYYFQCLEDCVLVLLSYDDMQRAYTFSPVFERYGRLVAEAILKMQQRRIEGFLFDAAEKRYLDFLRSNGHIVNRISLSHLASYLGIERPSLSRIRRRISAH